jgi:molybdopterin converting factor subunit 1
MQITVLYFAVLVDHTKTLRENPVLGEGATVAGLRALIEEKYPSLRGSLAQVRFAQNEAFVADETCVASGDTIALIPPVAGG